MRSATAVCGRRAVPTFADVAFFVATFTFHFFYYVFIIFDFFHLFVLIFAEFAAPLESTFLGFPLRFRSLLCLPRPL